jgi:4-diphosphocytidyl-2-C-methyl-D-erythritol kinase
MLLRIKSYAKVNLFLNVTGKRANGYHEIQSYFLKLQLADIVSIKPSKDLNCTVEGGEILGENIALKATRWFKEVCQISEGASIHIKKNIPIAAGLGGGSSNAAAALKLLPKLWGTQEVHPSQFNEIALKLGADVPFFLNDPHCLIEGIGEQLTPISIGKKLFLVLINPAIKILSKDAYSKLKITTSSRKITCDEKSILREILNGKNDLEEYAKNEHEIIRELLNAIKSQKNCLVGRMSGSGSTCFGIFDTKEDALNAADALVKKYPDFWIHNESN